MATLANLIVRINADAGNFFKEMKQAQKFTANIGKTFSLAGGALTRGITLPLIGVAGGLALMVRSTANAGEQLHDLSQRTGVSVEKLSAYKLAADLSGASVEDFGKGMRELSSHMFDVQNGSKEAQRAFESLGISVLDNNRNLRDSEEVFLDVAERFSQMEDGALKTALAKDIFGKSSMNLIPMLNLGKQGLIENAEEAKKLGIVWSGEGAKSADTFNDRVTKLWRAFDGLKIKIAKELFPVLNELIKNMTKIISESGVIQLMISGVNRLIRVFGALPVSIQAVFLVLGTTALVVGPFLIFLDMMITSISTLIPLVWGLSIALLALVGPWGLLAAGIAAVAGGAFLLNKAWDDSIDVVRDYMKKVEDQNKVLEANRANLEAARKEQEKLNQAQEKGQALLVSLRTPLETLVAQIIELNHLVDMQAAHTEAVIIDQGNYTRAIDKARETYALTLPHIKLMGAAFDEVGFALDATIDGVLRGTQTMSEAFRNMVQNILLSLQKLLIQELILAPLKGAIMNILMKKATAGGGFFTPKTFPSFQQGGRISGPALVGERGPELFIPDTRGSIVPNNELGGVTVNQIFNISPGVPEAVRREIMVLLPMLRRQAVDAFRTARSRGGVVASEVRG